MKEKLALLFILACSVSCAPSNEKGSYDSFHDLDEIRFSYSRAFHDPVYIRLRHLGIKGREYTMRVEIIHGDGINEDGKPDFTRTERVISKKEFLVFEKMFSRESLLQRSFAEPDPGVDGSSWVLIGRKGGLEILHIRWYPIYRKDKEFVEIGEEFLRFAGIKIPEGDDYY